MQQEIRFASFNVCNLALPDTPFYPDRPAYTPEQYQQKIAWIAGRLDQLDADVIGFQEIFSQQALKEALALTRRYRDAHHIGFEPEPHAGGITPSVALVSRLPVTASPIAHSGLPRGLSVALPGVANPVERFTRPILQARLQLSEGIEVDVFVAHLKSKRPDTPAESDDDTIEPGLASLRSLMRRGTEALGLRYLVAAALQENRRPLVVLGDFNDVAQSVPLQMVTGAAQRGRQGFELRLFDSYRLQSRRNLQRDIGYTHLHDGAYETVDHILVSEAFHPASRYAVADVLEVAHLNDHITLREPFASDHGLVYMRLRLREPAAPTLAADTAV